jgi:hypothetical protein
MSEILRSVQIIKQAKKNMLTVHSIQSVRMLMWQGRTMMWQSHTADVAGLSWRTVGSWMVESFLDTWHLWRMDW